MEDYMKSYNKKLACLIATICLLGLLKVETKTVTMVNWNDFARYDNGGRAVAIRACPSDILAVKIYGCLEIPVGESRDVQFWTDKVYKQSINNFVPVKQKTQVIVSVRQLSAIKKELMLGMVMLPNRRKVLLYNAPAYSVWHHPGGTTQLTAVLRKANHEVRQRYGHIIGLEYLLKSNGGQDVERLLNNIRGPNAKPTISDYLSARTQFEEISRGISTADRFSYERNNIVYQAADQDGTIEGVLKCIKNREKNIWYEYFMNVELPVACDYRPDVYGISTSDERQLIPGLVLASLAKEALPNTLVVLGGNIWPRLTNAFGDPSFAELFNYFDAIVYREGYQPLVELVESLRPESASGTLWRGDDGKVNTNHATQDPAEFQKLPTPDFSGEAEVWSPDFIPTVYTASNCHKQCGFCSISGSSDTHLSKPRIMTPKKIAEQMAETGAKKFDIVDELFRYDFQLELGAELRRIGYEAQWQCYVTMEDPASLKLTDPKVARELYTAGCRSVQLGLESLDPNTLLREFKGWNKPKNYGAILRNFRDAGIHTHVFLMVGIPGEPIHVGLKWIGFLKEYGDAVLTIKSGRYRLMRLAPEEIKGGHSQYIELLGDTKSFHVNRDFRYRQVAGIAASNTKVDALRDVLEQACRNHWAYAVTSTIPWWINRSRYSWEELEKMSKVLPPEAEVPHLKDRIAQMRFVVRQELGRESTFQTFEEMTIFAQTLL